MGKVLAQAVNAASSTAKHTVGERYISEADGKEYIYCQNTAGVALVLGDVCGYNSGFTCEPDTATIAERITTVGHGIALVAVPVSNYCWLQRYGANAAIHTGLGAPISNRPYAVSVTAGRLETTSAAATGGGLGRLAGIFTTTTCYTAGSTVAGFVHHPQTIRDAGQV